MAISDLLFPVFLIPLNLSNLQNNYSWLVGGQLGQALCKLLPFFSNVSLVVSIQNLILIAVDRFGAVVFPLRSPLIRSKLCPFFILTTWVVAIAVSSPYLFTYELVEYPEGTLVPFFGGVSTAVSSQNLILIAVDRFGSVVFQLRSPLIRSKLCSFFILATWIVAVPVHSPDLFAAKIVEYPEGTRCFIEWEKVFGESSSFASFALASYFLFIYIPVLLLVILYSIILIKLKTQAHPGEQSTNTQQQRNRRNRNVLQMSIAIVTVFVFCWLPFSINFLIILYQDRSTYSSCSFGIYRYVTYFVADAYCAVNPIICFVFSSNYRKVSKDS